MARVRQLVGPYCEFRFRNCFYFPQSLQSGLITDRMYQCIRGFSMFIHCGASC